MDSHTSTKHSQQCACCSQHGQRAWQGPGLSSGKSAFIFGVSPDFPVFVDQSINAQLKTLHPTLTALVDRQSRNYGPWEVGTKSTLNSQPITITGDYSIGLGILSDGDAIVSEGTFERLFGPKTSNYANLGLVKIAPGADRDTVLEALRKRLPADVIVVTRESIIDREQNYFVNVKPVGILFRVGMVVAFAAGAAILYQILSSEMSNWIGVFATL